MMIPLIGFVKVVDDERMGGEVSVAAASTDTIIHLDDASEFNEDGGYFKVEGFDPITYTEADFDANTLTTAALSAPLAAALALGEWVAPADEVQENTRRIAEVGVGDGPPVIATVPMSLRGLLPLGNRDPGNEEVVELIEMRPGEVEIRSVRSKEALAMEWGGGAGNGRSRLDARDYIEYASRNADPTNAVPTGAGRTYVLTTGGRSHLFFQSDDGSTIVDICG